MLVELKGDQAGQMGLHAQANIAAPSPVAAIRTTFWHILFTAERRRAASTITRFDKNTSTIDEHWSSTMHDHNVAVPHTARLAVKHTRNTGEAVARRQEGEEIRAFRISAVAVAIGWLFQKILELLGPRWMPQLPQRLGLDLANPLARHAKLPAHFFERAPPAVLEAEAHNEHLPLALGE